MPERTRTVAQFLGYPDGGPLRGLGITLIGYRPLRTLRRQLQAC